MRLDASDSYKRQFVDGKISKIKFVVDNEKAVNRFLTGFWNSSINSINCWEIVDSENFQSSSLKRLGTIETKADVNDIMILSTNKFVAGLGDGTLKFVDILENGSLDVRYTTKKLHNNGCVSALCVIGNTVLAGSDNGRIVRVISSSDETIVDTFASNLMGVSSLESCGINNFVSGHLTGQIHLWDIRASKKSFTISDVSHYMPTISRAASTLNDAITAIASHPAEPNVIAYGTSRGSVSFIDIRKPDEALPSLLKIAKDSINELKFNPSYPGHFFSSSSSSLIHWDTSLVNTFDSKKSLDKMEINLSIHELENNDDALMSFGNNTKKVQPRTNIWLSSKVWDLVQLNALLEDDPKYINTFDVSKDTIAIGSDTSEIVIFKNLNF